ncbi:MAG: ATP-binding protein [Pseudomonadota bacterium]
MSKVETHQGDNKIIDIALLLDCLPDAVLLTDRNMVIHYANAGAQDLFHSSLSRLLKTGLEDLIPAASPVCDLVRRAIEKNAPVNEYQIDVSTPRIGQNRIVDVHAAPLDGHSGGVVLTLRSRSMADRIDRQLTHRGAARSVTGLAAMLAHEIKNPLSGIRGAAQLLESVVKHEDKELARLITEETDRIVKIVDRMEVFSDITPIEPEPVNMHLVLGRVRQIAENGFGKDVRFVETYDPSLPDVAGSHDQLVQVFINLVKNAVEAMEQKSDRTITLASAYRSGIRIAADDGKDRASLALEFTVSDTGGGIGEEIRSHIFEPFVTSRMNGSGLGLALVAKIIGKHNGVIECDSSDKGTTFRILLPAWGKPENTRAGGNG